VSGCHCCDPRERTFDTTIARRDLKRYRRRGPDGSTSEILSGIFSRSLPGEPTLLDIGGGVGAIHHVLLDKGFSRATHIDASPAYLVAAQEESSRLHHTERVNFQLGDLHSLSQSTPTADVVTLDRVVCCDPDYVGMLGMAAAHARRIVAFSYPRPRWLSYLVVAMANTWRRILGNAFRAHIHSPAAMAAVLHGAGLNRVWAGGTWIWAVEVFERTA
jgi:magnesium-protoporphyrin O-methyltransferase